jgi:hypothetical protein
MTKFVVNYGVTFTGSVTVEAESEDQAKESVEKMQSSTRLITEADTSDFEIFSVELP